MSPLVPAQIAPSKFASISPSEGPDRDFSSTRLPGRHRDHTLHWLIHPIPVHTRAHTPLLDLLVSFIVVPLLAVFGQCILSPLCWIAPFASGSICAAYSPTGYLLTSSAAALGLFVLSSSLPILDTHGGAWYAVKLAACPLGSLLLQWLIGTDHDPRLLEPFAIFLCMSVGQAIAWAVLTLSWVPLKDVQWRGDETRGYEDGLMLVGGHGEFNDDHW